MERKKSLEAIKQHLSHPQHTILVGARQVGKTTLVKQLGNLLEKEGEQFHFLTFEDPTILKSINKHPENIFNYTRLPADLPDNKRLFLIIDEVQYAENPSNFLKLLYDKYAAKIKIIATGSSAFYIDKNFKDSLAGRKQVFELYPLDFGEFLHFKKEDRLLDEWEEMQSRKLYQSPQKHKINKMFGEYLVYGGYPAVVLANTEKEKQALLGELVNSFMKKDALEAGIREELKFFQLARILADQAGQLVNQHELGNTLQMSGKTVENYLYLLKKSFIIHLMPPLFGNIRKELTKMPKVFFNDNGLRNALVNNYTLPSNRADKGMLLENYVYTRLRGLYGQDALYYWRTADGNEVDFIAEKSFRKGFAYEVKYNDLTFKLSKYKKFMKAYSGFPLNLVSKEVNLENTIDIVRL